MEGLLWAGSWMRSSLVYRVSWSVVLDLSLRAVVSERRGVASERRGVVSVGRGVASDGGGAWTNGTFSLSGEVGLVAWTLVEVVLRGRFTERVGVAGAAWCGGGRGLWAGGRSLSP